MSIFDAADAREGGIAPEMLEAPVRLKPPTAGREVVDDYVALGFSLRAYPILFLRGAQTKRGAVRSADLVGVRDGARVRVAGLVLVRQRPGSANGVIFLTLEYETGPSNIDMWPSLVDRHRWVLFAAGMMGVEGRLQRKGRVEHVIADRLVDLSPALARVGERGAPPGGVDKRGGASRARSASRRTTSTPTSSSARRVGSWCGRGTFGEGPQPERVESCDEITGTVPPPAGARSGRQTGTQAPKGRDTRTKKAQSFG